MSEASSESANVAAASFSLKDNLFTIDTASALYILQYIMDF